ncbi:unnamed protein product [Vitrella brassicaformis CCMP3155]|uniref:Protein artemis n=2 Tax=Vitrella brassicaformis TaxID=1169539 RepID=A0A0G4FJJ0_VITBC|nr:unnamed protein product [Vitrella brassicaformis CCMP3155]|eukprot:CEM13793.1 unnamed protein product [Vitrella brassicaformis CCMP3155]
MQRPLPDTNIVVDYFGPVRGGPHVYFLTHTHADHLTGLSNQWGGGFIYCSPVCCKLLLQKFPHLQPLLVPLELNQIYRLSTNEAKLPPFQPPSCVPIASPSAAAPPPPPPPHDKDKGGPTKHNRPYCRTDADVDVMLVDASHCPGATMIWLQSPAFGSYLHTGDCRYEPPRAARGEGRVHRPIDLTTPPPADGGCRMTRDLKTILRLSSDFQPSVRERRREEAAKAPAVISVDGEKSDDDRGLGEMVTLGLGDSDWQEGEGEGGLPIAGEGDGGVGRRRERCVIDNLFLDNTYCHPGFDFPARAELAREVVNMLKSYWPCIAILGIDTLGKEDLLCAVAEALNTKVEVSQSRLDTIADAGFPPQHFQAYDAADNDVDTDSNNGADADVLPSVSDATTSNGANDIGAASSCGLVRAVSRQTLKKTVERYQGKTALPVLGVLLTGWSATYVPWERQGTEIVRVPYSLHSSYPELCELVRLIRPKKVTFTVPLPSQPQPQPPNPQKQQQQQQRSEQKGSEQDEQPPMQPISYSYDGTEGIKAFMAACDLSHVTLGAGRDQPQRVGKKRRRAWQPWLPYVSALLRQGDKGDSRFPWYVPTWNRGIQHAPPREQEDQDE